MKTFKLVFIFFISQITFINAQTITGVVLDQKTNEPLESVAVYFDNTTIGTSTNDKGEFSISYFEHITSPLIFSYLGYKKISLSDYTTNKMYKVLLMEDINTLDEVVISTNDGMPYEIKLKQFKKQFLGFSDNAKSCEILNENDLVLIFNKQTNELTGKAIQPILIKNKNLNYLVTFEIKDFIISYHYVDIEKNQFGIKSVIYSGTSFYKPLENEQSNSTRRKRDKAYEGSVLHFMRALSKEQLEDEGYYITKGQFKAHPNEFFTVTSIENSKTVKVNLFKRAHIFFKKKQSVMECKNNVFYIDQYGNHSPIKDVLFGGDMGNQRVGDALPFDYVYSKN